MKIKTKNANYSELLKKKPLPHKKPMRQWLFVRLILWIYALPDVLATRFTFKKQGMEQLGKEEPCLFLMNHSSFLDIKMVFHMLVSRPFHIVSTSDSFVGMNLLMRLGGCIPTKKFVFDPVLVKDMIYATQKLKASVVMFPEAGYSFDGTATTLPESLGKCIKLLKVPVVMITTYGAFARDPLYNNLQLRRVKASADMSYILSKEDIEKMSVKEINEKLKECFGFDNFRWQQENKISIKEKFRADGLNRVLYHCPHCDTEGQMEGKGIYLTCHNCGKKYELTEYGYLKAEDGQEAFTHVPDWYRWQKEKVRQEIEEGKYHLEAPVKIAVLQDTQCLYMVGEGVLVHDMEGFHLTGCDGTLEYHQPASISYTLNSDYFWYEIGDVIGLGDSKRLFYCFPTTGGDIVAKTRIATEEMYQLIKEKKKNS